MNKKLNTILNVALITVLAVYIVNAWMITEPSLGETVDYNKTFIITNSDVNVKLYQMVNEEYIEVSNFLEINSVAPGERVMFKFEISNTSDISAKVKPVFTNMEGNIDLLKNYLTFGITNDLTKSFLLTERLKIDNDDNKYYFDFIDEITIKKQETINIYWYILLNEEADNSVQGEYFKIDKIVFMRI